MRRSEKRFAYIRGKIWYSWTYASPFAQLFNSPSSWFLSNPLSTRSQCRGCSKVVWTEKLIREGTARRWSMLSHWRRFAAKQNSKQVFSIVMKSVGPNRALELLLSSTSAVVLCQKEWRMKCHDLSIIRQRSCFLSGCRSGEKTNDWCQKHLRV